MQHFSLFGAQATVGVNDLKYQYQIASRQFESMQLHDGQVELLVTAYSLPSLPDHVTQHLGRFRCHS